MLSKTKKPKSGVMKIFPQNLVDVNYWYMDKVRHDCFIIYIHSENPRIFLIHYKCIKKTLVTSSQLFVNFYTRVLYAICIQYIKTRRDMYIIYTPRYSVQVGTSNDYSRIFHLNGSVTKLE